MSETDTVTIRAEMFSDVPEVAAQGAAAIKAMSEDIATSGVKATSAVAQLGSTIDEQSVKTEKASAGGARLSKAYRDLYEQGGKLREGLSSLGESITERLQYPMQQATWALEGAAAGIVAFGLATGSSLQQANMSLTSFTGNARLAAQAVSQLRSLQGAVGLPQLESAYETLGQSGMSPTAIMSTLRGLSGISAVSLNPNTSMQSMSAAMAAMQSTGLLTPSDVGAFSTAGVDIWGILARETGQSEAELRTRFLRAGTPMAVPTSFMSDLMSTSGATGGSAAYDQTWAGQLEKMKKSTGDMLAVLETPLGNTLAGAAGRIDTWAQGTEARFKQLGGNLGKEWSSGNTGGLSSTLASIVGDPKLAGGIDIVVRSLHGLVNITEHSLIPMGKDIMAVATPALHGFADVLDFMGQHAGMTDTLIGTLGGLIVLSKVARWTEDANTAIKAFSTILESRGLLSALAAYSRGLTGLATAQESVAVTADAEAASEATASRVVASGGGMGGLGGKLGAIGAIGGGTAIAAQGMGSKFGWGSAFSTVGGSAAAGAGIGSLIPIPGVGAGVGAIGGAAFGVGDVLGRALGGLLGGGRSTNIRQVNITVPGSGNPQKVANAIPKALNAQINAQQLMAARRGAA